MQTDMHYYGTYAMARAAGLKPDACKIIATAAQYVDDNAGKNTVTFEDGAALYLDATAHHATDVKNIDTEDQRDVWVPFHFFPGNEGDTYTERLVCQIDSPLAREMVKHNLSLADKAFSLELMGVTAHVYADTFSHYGFSGVSSRHNMVSFNSIELHGLNEESKRHLQKKIDGFMKKYGVEASGLPNIKAPNIEKLWSKKKDQYSSLVAERVSGGLGHGAVLTYPDLPYLMWSFQYQAPKKWSFENAFGSKGEKSGRMEHNNPKTFLAGCEALHGLFQRFVKAVPQHGDDSGRPFAEISDAVADIFSFQGGQNERADQWEQAAKAGTLFSGGAESIPVYDENDWHQERDNLSELKSSSEAVDKPVYRFFQAVAHHRAYVLRDLLPSHGLIVN